MSTPRQNYSGRERGRGERGRRKVLLFRFKGEAWLSVTTHVCHASQADKQQPATSLSQCWRRGRLLGHSTSGSPSILLQREIFQGGVRSET